MNGLENLSLNDNGRKLVVGIDFGTTYSGVAWGETRRSDYQTVINSWPSSQGSREGISSEKVPTELRYIKSTVEWGFQIPPLVERFQWFKLGLGGAKAQAGQKISSEDLTAAYLTKLCEHLMYTLEQKVGQAVLRTIPIEFCLTVPAIWSEVAKEKTLKACERAGLKSNTKILLVSEPEAAAIYSLHCLDPVGLNVGDSFVLCDAGGGTVDLISYTITDLYPMLKVKEAAAGTGGLCGSTFLNRRFGEFLESKLSKEPGWDPEILAEAMERFDTVIKKQYSEESGQDGYSIPVAGLANNEALGIRRGKFLIKSEEMKSIFQPIVDKIIDLVKGQIKSTRTKIKAVLLVGGFGQNVYLKESLRNALGENIEVLQPPNAWTAVVRGAVMMGLAHANSNAGMVVSRAARKHYGIELSVEFDPKVHTDGFKYWAERDKSYRVLCMSWFIRKGDPVLESKPKQIAFNQKYAIKNGKPKSASIVVKCDEYSTTAPVHQAAQGRDLVTLEADLSHLTEKDLERTMITCADGNKYYNISGAVEATYYSASTKYVLLYMGKRYDTVTAEYV
ncbi:hypothetical protein F5884DRAFT_417421 [Xylogone sp. PMI_703]|nr:hypothetical protein F5884DRAFT_417421 [Xylogone sp. PMI_703]